MNRIEETKRRPSMTWMAVVITAAVLFILGQSSTAMAQWATNGNDINNTNTGSVGIGTTTPAVDANGATNLTLDGVTKYGEFSIGRNQSTPTAPIGGLNFFNSILGGAEKRVAAIWGSTDGATNSGSLQFYTWNAGAIAEAMRINKIGNVGIGTTTPNDRFIVYGSNIKSVFGESNTHTNLYSTYNSQSWNTVEIYSNGSAYSGLVFSNNLASGGIGGLTFANKGAGTEGVSDLRLGGFFAYTDGAANKGYLNFWTSNGTSFAERMRITNGGNVGIGNTNPTATLDVVGTPATSSNLVKFSGADSNGNLFNEIATTGLGGAILKMSGGGGTGFYLQSTGVNSGPGNNRFTIGSVNNWGLLTLKSDGNTGIGTSDPAYRLDVAGQIHSGTGGFVFPDGTVQTTAATGSGGASQWTTSGSNVYYNTGNIGIGTTTPQSRLQLGTQNSTLTAAPDSLSLGATYSNGAAQHLKLKLYDDGTYFYGLSVSAGQQEYVTPLSSSSHVFYAGASPLMTIKGTGQVGIGTTAPAYKLDVQGGQVNASGGLCIAGDCKTAWSQVGGSGTSQWTTSGSNIYYNSGSVGIGTATPTPTAKLDVNGNLSVTGDIVATGNIAAKYQDVAEWVPALHVLPAGTVVVLNPTKSNQVMASSKTYDTHVAGVVSAQPGLVLGERGVDKVMVATTGRVRVKVDARRAPIHIGDLLVTSGEEGMAMRSEPLNLGGTQIHRPGTLIGKALEPLESGVGEILVLLSLQ